MRKFAAALPGSSSAVLDGMSAFPQTAAVLLFVSCQTAAEQPPTSSQIFDETVSFLCENERYLSCTNGTIRSCLDNMKIVEGGCRSRAMLATTAEALRPQIQREVIGCIIEHHARLIELPQSQLDACYTESR
jgi:hypothetical protein